MEDKTISFTKLMEMHEVTIIWLKLTPILLIDCVVDDVVEI